MKSKILPIGPRDLVTIGVFGALSLLIFFVVGGIAGLTVVGTVANIPIVCLFTSMVYLLLAAKVKKPGTFLIMGTINVLPGLMAANVLGVVGSIAGWALAEVVRHPNRVYKQERPNRSLRYRLYITVGAFHSSHVSLSRTLSLGTPGDPAAHRRSDGRVCRIVYRPDVHRYGRPYYRDELGGRVGLAEDREEALREGGARLAGFFTAKDLGEHASERKNAMSNDTKLGCTRCFLLVT